MKQQTVTRNKSRNPTQPNAPIDLQDFEQLAGVEGIQLEHMTIPGFLRRIPHKWHLEEITRFGDKVGRAAEALQLSYITAIDRSLGVIRVFPRPLLERIYAIMGPQFNWPRILDVQSLEDGQRAQRDTMRKQERLTLELEELISATDEPAVVDAATIIVGNLKASLATLRAEMEAH